MVTSRDAAIALASSNNNTLSTAYTNTKISTEITRADAAIATNNVNNLALIKTYTVDQNFSNINLTGIIKYTTASTLSLGYNSSASINNSCSYGSNSQANLNNSVAIGDSATTASYFCTSIGNNSYSSGQGSTSLGCNSGKYNSNLQNANMSFCSYIGSNTGCDVSNSTYTYATCIGAGSVISSSSSVQLGRIGDNTTASNINTTNLTATTATINNLNINGTTTYNYSSLLLLLLLLN